MNTSTDWLLSNILEFMGTLYNCYRETTYAQDRVIYAKDIAEAMGWIADLKKGETVGDIITRILSAETDKHFLDYWRSGEWGEKEAHALKVLQEELRKGAVKEQ